MSGCYFYHTFFVELMVVVSLCVINLIYFFNSFPTITLTEIQKDSTSHPIQSLSLSDNSPNSFSLPEPLISFRATSQSCRYPFGKQFDEGITFNKVNKYNIHTKYKDI